MMQANVIEAAFKSGVKQLLFLGSSCIYPRNCPQPIKEDYLLTGELEQTNSAYAIAKIAGIELIKAYRKEFGYQWISVMPTNLFGVFDNFSNTSSHVLPALIRKFHDAKINNESKVTLWGSGMPKRELMEVDEFARALLLVIDNYDDVETINIGTGKDLTIKEISEIVKNVVGFQGEVVWDDSKPDGTPRKLLDVTKLNNLGFKPHLDLKTEIRNTYDWFRQGLVSSKSDLRL
jgi:GDP-L-fucose synthase